MAIKRYRKSTNVNLCSIRLESRSLHYIKLPIMITANRYHDISVGHRVYGHENKCAHLHGHNYRLHFFVEPYPYQDLDDVGRVIDFSVIKEKLCAWFEDNWDHKTLIWTKDPLAKVATITFADSTDVIIDLTKDIFLVGFNPTAENMAKWIVETLAPKLLTGTNTRLQKIVIEETRKCSVTYEL